MAEQQSKIAGKADYGNSVGRAYEALTLLQCFTCGEDINPGDLFTRQGYPGGGSATYPTCQQCSNFRLIPGKPKTQHRALPALLLPDGSRMKVEPRALDALAHAASLYPPDVADKVAARAIVVAKAQQSTKVGTWHVRQAEASMQAELAAVLPALREDRPGKAGADWFYQARVQETQ